MEAELALLNAPFEDHGWERAVVLAAAATGSRSANLIGIGGPALLPFNYFCGPNETRFAHYFGNASLWGPTNWRVNTTTRPMAIQREADYQAYRALNDTADYDDAVADLDLEFGCQSALFLGSGSIVGLAIMRGRREGHCDAHALSSFRALTVTMQRAIRMQLAIDGEAAEMMLGHFSTMRSATLLLDRHGHLAALTPAAEALFHAPGPFNLDGLALRLRHCDEHRSLVAAMARLLQHDGNGVHVHQTHVGRGPAHPQGRWRLYLVRLPAREHGLGFDPHLALTLKPAAASW